MQYDEEDVDGELEALDLVRGRLRLRLKVYCGYTYCGLGCGCGCAGVLWLYSLWRTMSEHEIWKRCARSVRLKTLLLSSMKLLLVR